MIPRPAPRFTVISALLLTLCAPFSVMMRRRYGRASARRLTAGMVVMVLAQQTLVWLVVRRHRGRRDLQAVDLMTLSRGVASALLWGLMVSGIRDRRGMAGWTAWLAIVYGAIVCDWLDGPIARRLGPSDAGAIFDLEADSWLTLSTAGAAVTWGGLPRYAMLPPIARYIQLATFLSAMPYGEANSDDPPWARRVGIAQMALFLAALAPFGGRITRPAVRLAAPLETALQLSGMLILSVRKMGTGNRR